MLDIILLVGGSSQIPLVQQEVKKAFGADKVVVHPRPMYAVAEGAAIEAAGLTERAKYSIQIITQNYSKLPIYYLIFIALRAMLRTI